MTDSQNLTVRFVTVTENADGQRLDNFLRKHLKGVPTSHLYRILRKGEVRVNKGRKKPDYKLKIGDEVRIPPVRVSTPDELAKLPSRMLDQLAQRVVYEDDGLLVLNKPAGLAVHGGSGVKSTALDAVRQMRPNQDFLELAHRLDRATSGCLVFAKSRESLQQFLAALQGGEIDKRYMAIVSGAWNDAGWVEHKLQRGEGEDRRVIADEDGKEARSHFKPIEVFQPSWKRDTKFTLVEVTLDTGRTHQIRAHAAQEGMPLLGDDKYGDFPLNRQLASAGCKRLCLHAHCLTFPWRGEKLVVSAEMDDDMRAVMTL